MRFHEFSWKISNFQSWFFSKFRCEIQVLFMRFHKFSWKISNFQSSPFYKFRCEIQVFVMRFHEFSWKNTKVSNFTLFPVQMWYSSIIHALSWIFMKKKTFKVHFFPVQIWNSSIIYTLSWIFMKKYQTFKVRSFPSSDVRFKYYIKYFMRFHEFSWKNIKLSKFVLLQVQMWDSSIFRALSWIFM